MRSVVLHGAVLCGFIFWANPAFSQNWYALSNQPSVADLMTCSASGSTLAVIGNNQLFTSTNSGATWTNPAYFAYSVGCSADGTHMAVSTYNGDYYIYLSTNSGKTWYQATNLSSPPPFAVIKVSADGTKIAAAYDRAGAFSMNFGASWSNSANAFSQNVTGLAASASGALVIASAQGAIYISTNYGFNWTTFVTSNLTFNSVVCSADATRWLGVTSGNAIYLSTNMGGTWTPANAPTSQSWGAASAAADGSKWIAPNGENLLYTSDDYGLVWQTNNAPEVFWRGVASSADGCILYAADGNLWMAQSTPAPQLNASASGSNLLLAWMVPSTNFVLQQSGNLTTTNWVAVTNAVTVNYTNLQDQVVVTPTNTQMYFRLVAP